MTPEKRAEMMQKAYEDTINGPTVRDRMLALRTAMYGDTVDTGRSRAETGARSVDLAAARDILNDLQATDPRARELLAELAERALLAESPIVEGDAPNPSPDGE